jgi:hypothetical protein
MKKKWRNDDNKSYVFQSAQNSSFVCSHHFIFICFILFLFFNFFQYNPPELNFLILFAKNCDISCFKII